MKRGEVYDARLGARRIVRQNLRSIFITLYKLPIPGVFANQQQAQAQGRENFIQWYRKHLQANLEQQITKLIKRVTTSPRSIQVRELGNRWASCGHQGNLYFHWRVAMLPPTMIEYLAVHELVHLIEPHHSSEFWQRVERILPNYQERKQWLAENGAIYNL